jgi:hypothetical protein
VTIKAPVIRDELTDQDAFTSHAVGSILWNSSHTNIAPQTSAELIIEVCDEIKAMLLEKNRKYGDSALKPTRIFSKADAIEQIKVRIDDKLTRMKNQQDDEDEDVVSDLIGYLVLLKIAKRQAKPAPLHTGGLIKQAPPCVPYGPPDIFTTPELPWWEKPTVTWNTLEDGHENSQAS